MSLIHIKIRNTCQTSYVDTNNVTIEPETYYLVETEHGVDIGCTCRYIKSMQENDTEKTGKVVKTATEEEINKIAELVSLEERAFDVCRKKITERKLEMKLVSVKALFDKTKIIFYFVAENRVDFRELVRDLAAIFKTRIEMRQIGARDETRIFHGFGLCGRELCCGFLNDGFEPVSIKMAKEQNLNLNSLKISGMCGRLLCCLSYEYDVYKELNKNIPSIDSEIDVGGKIYKVISVDPLKGMVRLRGEANIIDVGKDDIQKRNDKYVVTEETIEKLNNSNLKESNVEAQDTYSY